MQILHTADNLTDTYIYILYIRRQSVLCVNAFIHCKWFLNGHFSTRKRDGKNLSIEVEIELPTHSIVRTRVMNI